MNDEKLSDLYINQITALRDMSRQYKEDIKALAKMNPGGVMALQDENGIVAELIIETTQLLEEIKDAILTKSRELLQLVPPTHNRYAEMDAKLKNFGYGGRRKTRKRRKSRR